MKHYRRKKLLRIEKTCKPKQYIVYLECGHKAIRTLENGKRLKSALRGDDYWCYCFECGQEAFHQKRQGTARPGLVYLKDIKPGELFRSRIRITEKTGRLIWGLMKRIGTENTKYIKCEIQEKTRSGCIPMYFKAQVKREDK